MTYHLETGSSGSIPSAGTHPFEIRVIGKCKICKPSKFLDKSNFDCPRFWTPIRESAKGAERKSLSRNQSFESRRLELPLH